MNKIISADERIHFIFNQDPEWCSKLLEFVDKHPEFRPYMYMAPATRKPVLDVELKTIHDALLYYACHAGVTVNYGLKLWEKAKDLKTTKEIKNLNLSERKTKTLMDLLEFRNNHPIVKSVDEIKIKGIGEGAKGFIRILFFNDYNVLDCTDRNFLSGLQHLLGMPTRPTPAQAKRLCQSWSPLSSIGTAFCHSIHNYIVHQ